MPQGAADSPRSITAQEEWGSSSHSLTQREPSIPVDKLLERRNHTAVAPICHAQFIQSRGKSAVPTARPGSQKIYSPQKTGDWILVEHELGIITQGAGMNFQSRPQIECLSS